MITEDRYKHIDSTYYVYRIFYGNEIVYVGRTVQNLSNRIRGHVFRKKLHRSIDIDKVSKIEFAKFNSKADMYLCVSKHLPKSIGKSGKTEVCQGDTAQTAEQKWKERK